MWDFIMQLRSCLSYGYWYLFNFKYLKIAIGHKKDIISKEKQKNCEVIEWRA